MSKISLDTIIVPEGRHRKTFEGIDELAASVQDIGLIHPIIVDKANLHLIAGERRLRACRLLGLTELPYFEGENRLYCYYSTSGDVLDEWTRKLIELDENIIRKDLPYAEECAAKLQLHELYQQKFGTTVEGQPGGHRLVDTAAILGEAEGKVKQDIALAKAIRERPELANCKNKSAAIKKLRSGDELELRTAIAKILAEDAPQEASPIRVILGEALATLSNYPPDSFDFCITDPDWGVNVDDSVNLEAWGAVRVDAHRGLTSQAEIFHEVYRVLRPGAHCYVFFASMLQEETYQMLVGCGFTVRKIPLVWYKTRSGNIDAAHRFTSAYEPIFFAHKGKPREFRVPGMEDVFNVATPSQKVHPTEKPLALIARLVENCSVPFELGLDPYAGSGVFGRACRVNLCRAVLIERDPEYYTHCCEE